MSVFMRNASEASSLVLQLAVHLEQFPELFRLVVGRLPHALVDLLERCLCFQDIAENRLHLAVERSAGGGRSLLREIADGDILCPGDLARCRAVHVPTRILRSVVFPGPVGSDQSDAVVRADAEGDFLEEVASAELEGYVDGGDH